MGGLAIATVLTLVFLPALYVAWFRIKKPEPDAGQSKLDLGDFKTPLGRKQKWRKMKTFWSRCKSLHDIWRLACRYRVARRHPLLAHPARSAYARFLALSSRTWTGREGQQKVGYDPLATLTMNDRRLRNPPVHRIGQEGQQAALSRHSPRAAKR